MSEIPANHTLKRHVEPTTLTHAGVDGSLIFSAVSFKETLLPKRGLKALLSYLPMVSAAPVAMDIDLACVLLDKSMAVVDTIWYGQLRTAKDEVRHQGDALHGAENFEETLINQEEIRLRIDELPDQVQHIAFIISSWHDQPLHLAQKAETRLGDSDNRIAQRFSFNEIDKDCQALISWHLVREKHDWQLNTLMQPLTVKRQADKQINKLSQQVADILSISQAERW